MPIISGKDLKKYYIAGETKVEALKGLNFTLEPGDFAAFVGPSGSGKTTLLSLIGCLDKPTGGVLEVCGMDAGKLDRKAGARFRGQHIGFVFQDFNLIPVLTVYENIEYPLLIVNPLPEDERKKRIMALLEEVGMTDQFNKYPDQLSGGQKQRVAVARALVTRPKLVLADEPTANLDHKTAYLILELMKKMRAETGTTFIFSTHDQKIIGEAERVFTLEDGELVGATRTGGNTNA
ncbi:MAG: ABC transporter [Elusimicrobia bacterium RIFOXYA12_FULL_51_18]|nr:MAG: ABC transporter [Elusimicrobia bacterium RIFOXYA12_FULL_51_18]OGS29025.1 MAG: ABC transporter [Elusimicrobia bacterium RIFOXYA2_FULL_53_38]